MRCSQHAIALAALCGVLAASTCAPVLGVTCVDNDGHAVDWSFTYKLNDGWSIAYVDSNTQPSPGPLQEWPNALNATGSQRPAVMRTLVAMGEAKDAGYLMYNDQPPNMNPSSSYGHSKGVLAVGARSAFWLVHSTPKFPLTGGQWTFPETETIYAQGFLCISLKASEVDTVATQLRYIKPLVYDNTIPASLLADHPVLSQVVAKDWVTEPAAHVAQLTAGSTALTSLAKNAEWDNDLYESLVAKYFDTSLLVESWMRGEELGPYCTPTYPHDVTDVETLRMLSTTGANITWKETQDHSKWCVSPVSHGLLCVADENRMTSQRKRGGGAVCMKSAALYGKLFNTILTAATCG